jgi:CDP-glucose 4,6-dehydratase
LLLGEALLQSELRVAGSFNFGPSPSDAISVRQLVTRLQSAWPALKVGADPAASSLPETPELRLDSARAKEELGWRPVWNTERALERTVGWYSRFLRDGSPSSVEDLQAYVSDARSLGVSWSFGKQHAPPDAAHASRR